MSDVLAALAILVGEQKLEINQLRAQLQQTRARITELEESS